MNALGLVEQEMNRQADAGYSLETWPAMAGNADYTTIDEHEPFYLPRLEIDIPNAIIVDNNAEFAEVIDAVGKLSGIPRHDGDALILHEDQHADAVRYFGQDAVRTLIHLQVGRMGILDRRIVHPVTIRPAVIMEDVEITRLGMGLVLSAPNEPSDADASSIRTLGYDGPFDVLNRARQHNFDTNTNRYPVARE